MVDRYRVYLKRTAIGIPVAIFNRDLWDGFGSALLELLGTLWMIFMIVIILATYPVSMFVLAWVARHGDLQNEKARRQNSEWMSYPDEGGK